MPGSACRQVEARGHMRRDVSAVKGKRVGICREVRMKTRPCAWAYAEVFLWRRGDACEHMCEHMFRVVHTKTGNRAGICRGVCIQTRPCVWAYAESFLWRRGDARGNMCPVVHASTVKCVGMCRGVFEAMGMYTCQYIYEYT